LIILLAAWLRLAAFEEALVGADQSSILSAAAEIAGFRDFPLVGIKSSIGVMQTAVTPYLAAIPLLLVPKVIAVKWFFSILDLLALALLYQAAKRVFGRQAAVVTALLYAANPWIVEFVRWIWYQTLIPTFATVAFAAFLLLLSPGTSKRQDAWLIPGLFGATLMGLVHLAAIPWAALVFLLGLVIAWRRGLWRSFAVGVLLSLIAASPYLLYLIKSNFADMNLLLQGGSGHTQSLNWATYRLSWELLTGEQVLSTPRDPLWASSVVQVQALYNVVPILLGIAAAASVWRILRDPVDRPALAFSLTWTLAAPTLLLFTRFHLQHFYLLFLFPAPYVLIGALFKGWPPSRAGVRAKLYTVIGYTGIATLMALALWWTYLWTVRIRFENRGILRAPTRAWLMDRTVNEIKHYLNAEPESEVIVLTTFEGGDLSPFDWIRNFVHTDRVRVVPAGQGFIIPVHPTCYLLAPGTTAADLWPIASTAIDRKEMAIPATPPWPFYCVPARGPLSEPLARWQNGMSLLGTKVEGDLAPGARLQITHTWHYVAAPSEYHILNHLLLGETLVAQVDGSGVPGWYWRDDDVLITRFELQIPETLEPGEYRLLTGTYTWPAVDRVFLVSGEAAYEVKRWTRP
jgi:hypothetical protein